MYKHRNIKPECCLLENCNSSDIHSTSVAGKGLKDLPGQPVPMLHHPFSEEIFPNIQSKPPLVQLEAVSSCPVTCYLGEETDPTCLHPPFRQLQRAIRSPLSLLLSRLNTPSSPSCSSQDLCPSPFPSPAALPWTRSSPSTSLLQRGARH